MEENKVSEYRSKVIERFINLEWIINAIISQHYFNKIYQSFLLDTWIQEVLYDEYFSFAIKRRILEKIVPNIEKNIVHDINRLSAIRNYFAHCNQEIIDKNDTSLKGKVIDPRNINKTIDFIKLFEEFNEIIPDVDKYLLSILKKKGGIVLEKPFS